MIKTIHVATLMALLMLMMTMAMMMMVMIAFTGFKLSGLL